MTAHSASRPSTRLRRLTAAVIVTSLTAVLTVFVTTTASAAPTFKMPFPCGQTWVANNGNSSVHKAEELDFNRGSTAAADRGDTVVAAAAGTVKTAKNQGTTNGYGNLVTIDHGGGYVSYYAHLETMAVVSGQSVLQGQPIGSVGNSSYRNITPHLHFEIRLGSGYPGNIRAVPGYNYGKGGDQKMKSNNCATQQDPAALCGSGYVVNDTARLGSAGAVVLTYNKAAKNNCAVTLKFGKLGSRTATSVYITPQGKPKKADSGNFFEYAGPVRTNSPTCIRWGGAIGGSSYNSPSEHC
jgi:murein DD-endopeptidase MepM/ murein hydrolase activator NlpD